MIRSFVRNRVVVGTSLLFLAALAAAPAGAEEQKSGSDQKTELKTELKADLNSQLNLEHKDSQNKDNQGQKDDKEHKSAELQLISDQDIVKGGDSARFHILYHNKTGKAVGQCKLTVKVPAGLSLENEAGVEWNAQDRTATWILKNVEVGGARVLHFKLKVDVAAKSGTKLPVVVAGISDDNPATATAPVNAGISVGSHVNQPLFIGFPDGQFHPTGLITRAEAAAVVARVKQLPAATATTTTYIDVPVHHWAYGYIGRVTASGYMSGSGTRFNPDSPLSRGELVMLLLKLRGVDALPFQAMGDTNSNSAADYISTANQLQWIEGFGDGQFRPESPTERQTAAKVFTVALQRRALKDGDVPVMQHFPDVIRTAWSFSWVEGVSKTAHESRTDGDMEYLIRYVPDLTLPL